ncbi:MAG: hypothetical protein KF872_06050 [Chitinophagales bacterium]|nr:hypothetical protein [Chitinophagales bacterium]
MKYEITTHQSASITAVLANAETKISEILQQPVQVLLTSPKVEIGVGSLDDLLYRVAEVVYSITGITRVELLGKSRNGNTPIVRNIVYKVLYESKIEPSYKQVGRLFLRDHSTVLSGVKSANNCIHTSEVYRNLYHSILKQIQHDK